KSRSRGTWPGSATTSARSAPRTSADTAGASAPTTRYRSRTPSRSTPAPTSRSISACALLAERRLDEAGDPARDPGVRALAIPGDVEHADLQAGHPASQLV